MTIFQRPWSENLFILILTPSGQLTIWRGTSQIKKHVSHKRSLLTDNNKGERSLEVKNQIQLADSVCTPWCALDSVLTLKFEKSRSDFRTVMNLFLPIQFAVEACPHLLRVPIYSYHQWGSLHNSWTWTTQCFLSFLNRSPPPPPPSPTPPSVTNPLV